MGRPDLKYDLLRDLDDTNKVVNSRSLKRTSPPKKRTDRKAAKSSKTLLHMKNTIPAMKQAPVWKMMIFIFGSHGNKEDLSNSVNRFTRTTMKLWVTLYKDGRYA